MLAMVMAVPVLVSCRRHGCKMAHSLARVSQRPMLYTILRVMMNRRTAYTREQAVMMEEVSRTGSYRRANQTAEAVLGG